MAEWKTPKTDWIAGQTPTEEDANRWEGNSEHLKQQIDSPFKAPIFYWGTVINGNMQYISVTKDSSSALRYLDVRISNNSYTWCSGRLTALSGNTIRLDSGNIGIGKIYLWYYTPQGYISYSVDSPAPPSISGFNSNDMTLLAIIDYNTRTAVTSIPIRFLWEGNSGYDTLVMPYIASKIW